MFGIATTQRSDGKAECHGEFKRLLLVGGGRGVKWSCDIGVNEDITFLLSFFSFEMCMCVLCLGR